MIQKNKGLFYEDDKIEVFFGNKFFSLDELTNKQPNSVHAVRQTHSDIFHTIHRSEPLNPQPEGDALGTELPQQYLIIKTADCLPVMIHDPELNKIAAIHAGWKGVAIGIVPKTIKEFFSQSNRLRIYIGPHIAKSSFEIKSDVLQQLKITLSDSDWTKISVDSQGDRFYLELADIVKLQILSHFPKIEINVFPSDVDTKTNLDYNSFRRDAANAGRNISYIRLK